MKLKDGFVLTKVGEDCVAVPVDSMSETFHGIIRLNKTCELIWRGLQEGLTAEEITGRMVTEYDVDVETARCAVRDILDQMVQDGFAEE